MFIPYLSSGYELTYNKDKTIINCNFGSAFKARLRRLVNNEKKLSSLFVKLTNTSIIYYKFFTPEVIAVLEALLGEKYLYGLNVRDIEQLTKELRNKNSNENIDIDFKNISRRMEFSILPHQMKIFDRYKEFINNYHYRGMLIDADPGTGKAQPLYSKILTPTGWKKMGEIKIGDKVIAGDRTITEVIGVYPQGLKDIYEIEFEDGRKTRCCKEHLWTVYNKRKNQKETLPLSKFFNNLQDYAIPLLPMDLENENLFRFIDPETNTEIKTHTSPYYQFILDNLDLDKGKLSFKISGLVFEKSFQRAVWASGGVCKISRDRDSHLYLNTYTLDVSYENRYMDIKSITYIGEEEAQCIKVSHKDSLYVTDDYIVTHNTFSSLALSVGRNKMLTIIICPLNTSQEVWIDSIAGPKGKCVFKEPQSYWSIKDGSEYRNEEFIICHYEGIGKLYEFLQTHPSLEEVCFIIDESHNMANGDSKRTLTAIECINYVASKSNTKPEVFLLSGTPLKSSFKEMIIISKFIDPLFTKEVEKKFLILYNNPNEFFSKLLTARYTGYSIKVKKDSLGLSEPITQYIKIKIPNGDMFTLDTISVKLRQFYETRLNELKNKYDYYFSVYKDLKQKALENGANVSSRELKQYEDRFEKIRQSNPKALMLMGNDLLKEVNSTERKLSEKLTSEEKKIFIEAKTIVKYPELKVQGEALGKIITGARIDCHSAMAAAINYRDITNTTKKKTVVFSSYIKTCQMTEMKMQQEKLKFVSVYGDKTKDLAARVQQFTKDPKIDAIIATYKSLSTGVPLTAGNVVICLDLPFRIYMYNQAISRVWRLGQDQQVYVYILTLDTGEKPNINSRNVDIITFFKNEIEKITGYKSNIDIDFGDNEFSLEDFQFDYNSDTLVKKLKYNTLDIWS